MAAARLADNLCFKRRVIGSQYLYCFHKVLYPFHRAYPPQKHQAGKISQFFLRRNKIKPSVVNTAWYYSYFMPRRMQVFFHMKSYDFAGTNHIFPIAHYAAEKMRRVVAMGSSNEFSWCVLRSKIANPGRYTRARMDNIYLLLQNYPPQKRNQKENRK